MPARKAFSPPPQLNDRQRAYLTAAYQQDQRVEQERAKLYQLGRQDRRKAAEWRPMPYGLWQHPAHEPRTPLRQRLEQVNKKLISEGTGSTWRALADRGLVEMVEMIPLLVQDRLPVTMHYQLPHVKMTTAGRKLARELLGEVRAPKAAALARSTWQVLVALWQADAEAARDRMPAFMSGPAYERLARLAAPQNVLGRNNQYGERILSEWPTALTPTGRIYYYQHYAECVAAYPDVEAPDPGPLPPELHARVEQLEVEALALLPAPPAGWFERWTYALKWKEGFLEHHAYVEAERRGLPEAPPPAGPASPPAPWTDHLLAAWSKWLTYYYVRQHLTPAEYNRYRLWQVVELQEGKLAWKHSEIKINVAYHAQQHLISITPSRYAGPYEIQQSGRQALRLALLHRCSRWYVHLRYVEDIMRPHIRRGLVKDFIHAGMQLYPTEPLRVAVIAPQISLTEWQQRLAPEDLQWWALEWHEVPNVPAAEAWLTQPG